MAIFSMTGFGRAETQFNNKRITIEVRALNSKQLDLNIRMPQLYRSKEMDLRNLAAAQLKRGKVDISITTEEVKGAVNLINAELFKQYYASLIKLSTDLGIDTTHENMLATILRLPEVMDAPKQELEVSEWNCLEKCLLDALSAFQQFRIQEGKALTNDIKTRVQFIEEAVDTVCPFEEARIQNLKTKIRNEIKDLIGENSIDQNRFEQELIYYIEKLDITEEKVRLRQHCAYFFEVMETEETPGRKLGFIAQELGREINTMGSKANESNIQRLVIGMKDELEKIKEQLLNIL